MAILHSGDATMAMVEAGIHEHRRRSLNPWSVRNLWSVPRSAHEIGELVAWRPDGLLAVAPLPAAVIELGIPSVSIRHRQSAHAVVMDDHAVGRLAAEHVAGLGAATIAALRWNGCDTAVDPWCRERRAGFRGELARRGLRCRDIEWRLEDRGAVLGERLLAQLRAMRPPVAVFAVNDWFASELTELVRAEGLDVPGDVAVLGADDLPRSAEVEPALSSVRVPHRQAGRVAAHLLDRVLAGEVRRPLVEEVAPEGVSVRASTDALGVRDPQVHQVLCFIRTHAGEPFSVDDAIAACDLRRRSIEQRFRALLGTSILEQIRLARIERAKRLLVMDRRPIGDVALDCGFADAAHFTEVFRALVGQPPSRWRRDGA